MVSIMLTVFLCPAIETIPTTNFIAISTLIQVFTNAPLKLFVSLAEM